MSSGLPARRPLVSTLLGVLAVVVLLGSLAVPARASRLVTWKLHSRFVDATTVVFGQPPSCACTPHAVGYLPVNVLLPDGYDGKRRFPVVYLLHGSPSAYDMWMTVPGSPYARGGDLKRIAKGFPGIIVMPYGGAYGWYTNWWNGGRRGDPAWERYLLDELVSRVQRRLKILPGRRAHAMAGLSMGGFGAAFLASQRPGYFGSVALMSPGLIAPIFVGGVSPDTIFGDPVAQRFYRDGHDPFVLIGNLRSTSMFVVSGNGVAPPPNEQGEPDLTQYLTGVEQLIAGQSKDFVKAARRAGLAVRYEQMPGIHEHPLFRRELPDVLRWLRAQFRRPAPVPRHWSYKTVAQTGDAFGFRFTFHSPPTDLITFTRDRGSLSATGTGVVDIRTPIGRRFTATLPFKNHAISG